MNIFRLEVRNLRKGAIISSLVICGFILVMLLFFPSMANESMQKLANAKLDGVSPSLLKALGLSTIPDFSIITNYFGYVIQFITLGVMVIIVQQSTNSLIKEETDGTIEYLFSKPVSRGGIFVQKVLTIFAYILFLHISFFIITVIGYLMVTDLTFIEIISEAFVLFGASLFVGLIFSSIGILCSTIIKSSKSATGITIGIVFGTFILGIMSAIVSDLDFLIWLSPMEWIKSEKLMSSGILIKEWIVGITVMLAAISLAYFKYNKKDLLI